MTSAAPRSWLRSVSYFGLLWLATSVPLVLTAVSYGAAKREGAVIAPLPALLFVEGALWYSWIGVVPIVDRFVRQSRPQSRRDRARQFGRHAVLFAGFTALHGVVGSASARLAAIPAEPISVRSVLSQTTADAVVYLVAVAGFTVAEARRRRTEATERLRAEVAEARLDALRQQLNPHFLFNTLNHIVVQLRSGEVDPALKMLLALSELLRQVLRERAQLIPLRDELQIVERFLEIERARFGERLHAEITFEPKALDALVPSLVLQPLLENAMRHGVSVADGACRVWLTARVGDGRLRLDVRDAGPGVVPEAADAATGIGLRNTRERLRYLYGSDHGMHLQPLADGGLLVELDLPLQR